MAGPTIDDLIARSMTFPVEPYREGGDIVIEDDLLMPSYNPNKQFRRTGGCHQGCGACCEQIVLPIDPRVLRDLEKFDDWRKWVEYHPGMKVIVRTYHPFVQVYIDIPCSKLEENKDCGVYGTDERPKLCGDFPKLPYGIEDIGLGETCTYKWYEEEK